MAITNDATTRVLVVEDNATDMSLVHGWLQGAGEEFELRQATTLAEAVRLVHEHRFDIVLLDLLLPDSAGLDTLSRLRLAAPTVPIVVLSNLADPTLSLHALERGAQDYLTKSNITDELIGRSLRYAITRHRLQAQLQSSERQLNLLAEQLPAMLWTTDEFLKLTSSRGRELRTLNVRPDQITGRQVNEFFGSGRMSATISDMHRRALLGEHTSADWEWHGRWFYAHVEPLTNSEREIVGTIGVAIDVTNERKLKKDVQAAHHVQQHLLPARAPSLRGFDIAGMCFPAEDCSGDFFDYLLLPSGRLCIVLADVSGHGFGPAILAAAIRSYLRTAAVLGNEVHEMLALGNRLLLSDGELTPFASVIAASVNVGERSFRYASAGHPGYLLRATGESTRLETMSVPIGVRNDELFTLSSRILLRTGDILLLASDGVFEARDSQGQYYGVERALETVRNVRRQPAEAIVRHLHDAAIDFAGRRSLDDDLTAVVVKVTDPVDSLRDTWP